MARSERLIDGAVTRNSDATEVTDPESASEAFPQPHSGKESSVHRSQTQVQAQKHQAIAPAQHRRASGPRRLSGRLSLSGKMPVAISQYDQVQSQAGLAENQADSTDQADPFARLREQQQAQSFEQLHAALISQVKNWLMEEQGKRAVPETRPMRPADVLRAPGHRKKSGADAVDRERELRGAMFDEDREKALKKLETIVNENETLAAKVSSALGERSWSISQIQSRRVSSIKKRSIAMPSESDLQIQDREAVVPSADVVLDNSKTLCYTGGGGDVENVVERSADSSSASLSSMRSLKEKDAWTTFKNEIVRLILTLKLKGWKRFPLDFGSNVEVQRLTGALTNAVYVISPPKDYLSHPQASPRTNKQQPPKLLLRIYGPQAEYLIDREAELNILKRLAHKKIGPRILGTFLNGRFEEFLYSRTLSPEDLRVPETSCQIAKRMRELHEGVELLPQERSGGPSVWLNWDKWIRRCDQVMSRLDQEILKRARDGTVVGLVGQRHRLDDWKSRGLVCGVEWPRFRRAINQYRAWLEEQYGGRDRMTEHLIFAHNDTQYGNLLRLLPSGESPLLLPANEHKQLVVIDFEYANANTRGYEFANHFTEWCYDYNAPPGPPIPISGPYACRTALYPTPSEQRRFVTTYVQHRPQFQLSGSPQIGPLESQGPKTDAANDTKLGMPPLAEESQTPTLSPRSDPTPRLLANCNGDSVDTGNLEIVNADVERLLRETRMWRAACSAHWVAWAIVQATVPGFDDLASEEDTDNADRENKVGAGSERFPPLSAADAVAKKDEKRDEKVDKDREAARHELAPHDHETEDDLEYDYLALATDRAMFCWGDLLDLGIVSETELPEEVVKAVMRVPY